MSQLVKDRMIKARVKLLRSSPFFGTLLLNAKWKVVEDDITSTMATDGDILFLNEKFVSGISEEYFTFVLLHEVLHMALQHVDRMKDLFTRDAQSAALANMAADIVVNGIVKDNGFDVPHEAITDDKLKHLSVREIFTILQQQLPPPMMGGGGGGDDKSNGKKKKNQGSGSGNNPLDKKPNDCLKKPGSGGKPDEGEGSDPGDQDDDSEGNDGGSQYKDKTNWKDVLNKANIIAKSKKAGAKGAGIARILDEFLEPTINWRDVLYRFVTNARTDFEGFDRRFIHQGDYFDDLGGTRIKVALFMDTSGSVDEQLLSEFFAELRFAINALPGITGEMWYFDTELYPEGPINEIDVPRIRGGGGTSFVPAMKKLQEVHEEDSSVQTLGIMFTDGYACMDNWEVPECSLLWCISPGGLDNSQIPHGEVVRITK